MRGLHPGARMLAGVALSAWAAAALADPCKLEQMEIPVRVVEHRPIATLVLNGTTAPMLLDSGAFYSTLSESTANDLKLRLTNPPPNLVVQGYTGRVEIKLARVEKVGLRGVEVRNLEFIVGGNELNAGIVGVLGRNILAMADTEYDLAHGAVRISLPKGDCDKTDFAYWAGEAPVVVVPLEPVDRNDTGIRVRAVVNGVRTKALLDTGAPFTALTAKAAARAGIAERDMTPNGRSGGLGEGRVRSWTAPVALFELGGEKIADNRLEVNDVRSDEGMLVGLDYFLSHRIYVSRLQGQVYVTWNGGPVFAQGRETKGAYDPRYAALPPEVAKDDADALARRGAAALAAGNLPGALEDLNRACEIAPDVASHFHDRARVRLAMREFPAALADADEALRLDPAAAQARLLRARLRERQGDRAGAQADLAQLDATLVPSAPLRADMAQLLAGFGRTPEALRQFELWVGTHPRDVRMASILGARCWLRTRMNVDLKLALEDCKEAVDRDDDEASFRDSLGWTYLRLGDMARAKRAFDGSIELKPLPFSLYGRGLAQLGLKDAANGERDLAAARQLQPSIDADVRQAGFEFADAPARSRVSGP